MECDEDGWVLQVNDEPKYPTFFHQFSPTLIQSLRVKGKIEVSYVGFGAKGMILLKHMHIYFYTIYVVIYLIFVCVIPSLTHSLCPPPNKVNPTQEKVDIKMNIMPIF